MEETECPNSIILCYHHGAEISVIWLVKRIAIKLLILIRYQGETNFEVQRYLNVTLVIDSTFRDSF